VFGRSFAGLNHHEAGVITFFSWMLGDEVFGKVIIVGTKGKIFLHHALG
jgi:hypothetical protein